MQLISTCLCCRWIQTGGLPALECYQRSLRRGLVSSDLTLTCGESAWNSHCHCVSIADVTFLDVLAFPAYEPSDLLWRQCFRCSLSQALHQTGFVIVELSQYLPLSEAFVFVFVFVFVFIELSQYLPPIWSRQHDELAGLLHHLIWFKLVCM